MPEFIPLASRLISIILGVKGIGGIFRLLQYFSIELWDRLVIFKVLNVTFGAWGSVVVKALRY